MNENETMMTVSTEETAAVPEAPAKIAEDTAAETPSEAAEETSVEAVTEAPVEAVAETPAEVVAEAPKKKKRIGLKITILVIVLLLAFAGVSAVSFFLGRNPDFEFSKLIPSFEKEEEPTEPAEFFGMWEGEDHTFCASAGNIIELDGKTYTCTWDDKTITLRLNEDEEVVIGYKRTSNRIKLWKDGDKDDSVYLRRNAPSEPEKLCGSWVHGDTVISFSDMGTADIYGGTYDYTADGFEITCQGKSGREYMFYTIDGENLILWQPGESDKKLSFIREGSLVPKLVGTWVLNNGTEYVVISKDGTVEICDLTGRNSELYEDIVEARVENETIIVRYPGTQLTYNITLDNDYMKLDFASKLVGEYYRVSEKTNLSVSDVEFMWSIYSIDENI